MDTRPAGERQVPLHLPTQGQIMLQLFGYWRSSASYRVRIVMQLKGLDYEQHPVNLRQGEQREKAYRRLNPQGLVPFLVDGEVQVGQSVAIMEYLDETYPAHPLMPSAPQERARVRQIVNMIACDIHPSTTCGCSTIWSSRWGRARHTATNGIATGLTRPSPRWSSC